MSYLVVDSKNVILAISDTIGYQDNGNALLKNGTMAIPPALFKQVVEVQSVDTGVEEMQYCYDAEKGFYKNPDYVAPTKTTEQTIADLQATIDTQAASITALQAAVATALGV